MAAANRILNVVIKAMKEAQHDTVDKAKVFILEKMGNEKGAEVLSLLEDFKKGLGDDIRRKRKANNNKNPSAYTVFIRDMMGDIKKRNAVKNGQELMRLAVEEWMKIPEPVKIRMKELNKEDPSLSGIDLLALASK